MTVRGFLPLIFLCLLAVPCEAQSRFYVHPNVGFLTLDFDLVDALGIDLREKPLVGLALGLRLTRRMALEGRYESAGFDLRSEGFEPIGGRFHIVSAGLRGAVLDTRPVDLWASVSPGILITTTELTDASRNFALPVGLDLVVFSDRRLNARGGVRDFLHHCNPPEGFDDIICNQGEWLHHVAVTAGVELQL